MTEPNKKIAKTVRRTEYQAWKRLRLAAYVLAVGAVGSGLAFRSAYAGLQDQGMAMGRELMQVGDVVRDKYRVRVNGEPVWVNNVNVDGTKKEILDQAEAMCRKMSGGLDEEYKKFPPEFRKTISGAEESAVMGVLRQEAGDEGVVACIVNPNASGGFNGFVGRMEEFGKTRDLAAIGNLRYVYVKESGGTTRMLTAFTEGSFRLDRFAPETGEPAGTDPTDAPRPKSSVRLMSAEVDGAAYGTRMYESTESSKTILAQFDAEMPGHGWTNPAAIPGREHEARLFMKDGQDFILLANEDRGRTYVTMIQSVTRQARSRVSAKLVQSDNRRMLQQGPFVGIPTSRALRLSMAVHAVVVLPTTSRADIANMPGGDGVIVEARLWGFVRVFLRHCDDAARHVNVFLPFARSGSHVRLSHV